MDILIGVALGLADGLLLVGVLVHVGLVAVLCHGFILLLSVDW